MTARIFKTNRKFTARRLAGHSAANLLPFPRLWPLHLLPALALIAACDVQNNAATTGSGGTQIQIQNGQNCWENRCFRLSTSNRAVQLAGRNPARVPSGIDLSRGYVTPSEFQQMFQAANMASAGGSQRR